MHLRHAARAASLALLLTLPRVATAEEAPDSETSQRAPTGLYIQPHVQLITGWTIREASEQMAYPIEVSSGGGMGLRLGYDFSRYVGVFASAELDVESEGPYFGYGGGLALHTDMLGPVRLNAKIGVRLLPLATTMPYGTGGLGVEYFPFRRVSAWLEFDAAFGIGSGTRAIGETTRAHDSTREGPKRGVLGLTWYVFG